MPYHESAFNPYFRKNLLQYCVGKKLLDIRRFYSKKEKERLERRFKTTDLASFFYEAGYYIELILSDDIHINISFPYPGLVSLLNMSESIKGGDGIFRNDYSIAFQVPKMDDFVPQASLLKRESGIKNLLGQEIKDVFLLEETDFFDKSYYCRDRSDSKIGGFGFELNEGSILFCKGGFENVPEWRDMKSSLKLKKDKEFIYTSNGKNFIISPSGLLIDINEDVLRNGIFKKSKDYCEAGKEYIGYTIRSRRIYPISENRKFILPKYDYHLKYTADVKDVYPDTFLDIRINTYPRIRIKENIQKKIAYILSKYGMINLKDTIDFFRNLKDSLSSKKCTLSELKFGIERKSCTFCILRPIDILPDNVWDSEQQHGNPYSLKKRTILRLEIIIEALEATAPRSRHSTSS